jgi:hypothetical protein
MTNRQRLRPVAPGKKAPRKKTMIEAIDTRDDVALIEALRARLVAALSSSSAPEHTLAPLARQVAQLTETLDLLVRRREADASEAPPADDSWDADAIWPIDDRGPREARSLNRGPALLATNSPARVAISANRPRLLVERAKFDVHWPKRDFGWNVGRMGCCAKTAR